MVNKLRLAVAASTVFAGVVASSGLAFSQWSTGQTLQAHRSGATVAFDGSLYYSGGDSTSFVSDRVEQYVASTGSWTGFQMPTSRRTHAAATWGGELFFAGGVRISPPANLDSVDIYNVELGTWRQETMPFAALLLSATAIDGKLFLAGGIGVNGILRVIQILDIPTGTWSIHHFEAPGRAHIAGVQDERWACFAGGSGLLGVGGEYLNVYDSFTGMWEQKIMPHAHKSAAAAISDGKLYVAGGIWPDDPTVVDVLDLESGVWSVLDLPTPRFSMTAFGLAGYVGFAAGTTTFGSNVSTAVDLFNTRTGEWHTSTLSVIATGRIAVASEQGGVAGVFCGQDPSIATNIKDMDLFHAQADLGLRYCSPAVVNTTGVAGRIGAMGLTTVSENFFTLYAEDLPRGIGFGLFLISGERDSLPGFGGSVGTLCLRGPARILSSLEAISDEGIIGSTFDLNALPPALGGQVQPGDAWHFQAWYRDDSLSGGSTSNFTDAIRVSFN